MSGSSAAVVSSPGRWSSHQATTAVRNAADASSSAVSAPPPSFARLAGVNRASRRSGTGTSVTGIAPTAVAAISASRERNASGSFAQSTCPGDDTAAPCSGGPEAPSDLDIAPGYLRSRGFTGDMAVTMRA
jgi:hypothetical protein